MATQNYSTVASRNLIRAEGKLLKEVESIEVLGQFGTQEAQPLNKTDTIVFRRLDPFNMSSTTGAPQITAANFVGSEGVTPTANTIDWTDVTVTLTQYEVLYKFSSKVHLTYEDDIPEAMVRSTARTLAEVKELVAYGQFKSGSSVSYANGSTRAGVYEVISINKLRSLARSMETNRATPVTTMIKPGPNFGTIGVEPGYVVFVHSDVVADCRDLPKFTERVNYGTAIKPLHNQEFGACEEFRFVKSPLFAPYLAGGAAVATYTGKKSVAGVNIDVYPCIIMAEDAWGHVSLKGHGFTGISPTIIPAGEKNHANPSGKFGYVGADFWYVPVRLNENWMKRLEVAVTDI
jgi:N4-gp56 family major capsid protein